MLWVFFLHVCPCLVSMPGAHKGWGMVLDPLGLELQVIVNRTQVLWKGSGYSPLGESPLSPDLFIPFKCMCVSNICHLFP